MLLRRVLPLLLAGLVLFSLTSGALAQSGPPAGPAAPDALPGAGFTYQGELKNGSGLVNATCDFRFSLFDAASAGALQGASQTVGGVTVANGRFTVLLNGSGQFGANAFVGQARWLAVEVKCPPDAVFSLLSPRQPLSAAPLALALPGLRTEQNITSTNVIGGYGGNTVGAGVVGATIGGGGLAGLWNQVDADFGTISGGINNEVGSAATVGGGDGNLASGIYSTVSGGGQNSASSSHATVGGGGSNTASGPYSSVSGGAGNTASAPESGVLGGANNVASGSYAAVVGGQGNLATNTKTFVGGGDSNTASGNMAVVGGGDTNTTSGNFAVVSGGSSNIASAGHTTVDGGSNNTASGSFAIVGGGFGNTASGVGAVVGGGGLSLSLTSANTASGGASTVGGGLGNVASADYATVPGGVQNVADGAGSFAAGYLAHALHSGSFVWADGVGAPITSTVNNEWVARASGGVTFWTNGAATVGAHLATGSSSWSIVSDRNLKANFATVSGLDVLNALAGIPIQTWNYTTQDAGIRHIGPMAQDFAAAFQVGENNTTISTVDAQGVALAAIQGLYTVVKQKDAELDSQQAQITALQAGQADLNARLALLQNGAPAAAANSLTLLYVLVALVAGVAVGGGLVLGAFALGRAKRA